jgi:hypothetical protein
LEVSLEATAEERGLRMNAAEESCDQAADLLSDIASCYHK